MLINARFLTRPATGVDRFAIELLGAIKADKTRSEFVLLVSRGGSETAVLRVKLNR